MSPSTTIAKSDVTIIERDQQRLNRARSRPTIYWVVLLISIVLLTEQSSFGANMVSPILPAIAEQYQTTQVVWTLTLFTLVGAIVATTLGRLADIFGKKRLLVLTALVATAGSIVCALAPTFTILLIGRGLASVGMVFLPLGYALIRDTFPTRMVPLAIGVSTSGVGVSLLIGPYLAAWLSEAYGVHAVFWMLAAIPALGGLLVLLLVPETPLRVASRIDGFGALLLTVGIGAVMVAISQANAWGWTSPTFILVMAAGLVVLGAWGWWQTRAAHPLIDIRLVTGRNVLPVFISAMLAYGMLATTASILPSFLQAPTDLSGGLGLTATQSALVLIPGGAVVVATGFIVGGTGRRFGFRNYQIIGALIMAIGNIMIAFVHWSVVIVAIGYVVVKLGNVHVGASANLVITAVPADQRGVATTASTTLTSMSSSLCVQIAFALLGAHIVSGAGQPLAYGSEGWQTAFLFSAALGLAAVIVAFAIPRWLNPGPTAAQRPAN